MIASRIEQCAARLRAQILALVLLPGVVLDPSAIARDDRIPLRQVREVLSKLITEGYIVLGSVSEFKVASMDAGTMRTFFQTAPLIYSTIARHAAENCSDAQIETLKDIQMRFSKAAIAGNNLDAAIENHQFHTAIGDMADNPYLVAALRRLLIDHTRLAQRFFRPDTAADQARVALAIAQHDAMIEAFETRQVAHSIELALQHWDLSQDQRDQYVLEGPQPFTVYQADVPNDVG